jgi:hypothetical protein
MDVQDYLARPTVVLAVQHGSVEAALSEILAGDRTADDLTITYQDLHPFWGGIVLTMNGTGVCERRQWDRGATAPAVTPGLVTPAQLRDLLRLLLNLKIWEQQTPERAPAPDEVRAALTVQVGELTAGCWEWFQELKQRNRLSVIRAEMSALVQTVYERRASVNREAGIELFRRALAPVLASYGVSGSPSERERAEENYVLGDPASAHVEVSARHVNGDPYEATVAVETLKSAGLVHRRSGAPVEISVRLEYLAWSSAQLELRLVGPPSEVEILRDALAPALRQCEFGGPPG